MNRIAVMDQMIAVMDQMGINLQRVGAIYTCSEV